MDINAASFEEVMALPVATEADLSPANVWGAWETNGHGWELRRSRNGWVRTAIDCGASPECDAPSA